MVKETKPELARRLLLWYDQNKRDLPWRRSRDPYAIWVSEIMLQQTKVETVLPYYARFLERFPGLEDLARADLEEVVGLWSGLGYYGRARRLHKAAQGVVAAGGEIPDRVKELQALPGVGSYTAAAIGSIAFGRVVPAIDGNVERVMTRYRGIVGDPRRGEPKKLVERSAGALLDEGRPGDSNQALMELGATTCRPRNPSCSDCPLQIDCRSYLAGDPEALPTPRPRSQTIRVERRVGVVRRRGRVLLFRRHTASEVLPGMWELPWVEGDRFADAADRFAIRYGGVWDMERRLGDVRHAITNHVYEIEIWEARLEDQGVVGKGPEAGWFDPRRLEGLPMSSLVLKVLGKAGLRST